MLLLAIWLLVTGQVNGVIGFLAAPLTAAQTQLDTLFVAPAAPAAVQTASAVETATPEPVSVAAPAADSFTLPSDLQQMEAEYLARFDGVTPSGTINERDFRAAAVSATAGKAAIRNATATKTPDFDALLQAGADLTVENKAEPLVLLFHTHTTESYLLSDNGVFWSEYSTRSTLADRNIVRVGEELAAVLRANGIGVIHDTTVYDSSYNGAYARSREGIEKILKENPGIRIVLDVHRDAIYYSASSRGKPVCEIEGRKAAQIMIITGAQEGLVESFPDWEYNLRFALELQNAAGELYEGLMKPIYFCQRKYNMDVSRCSLLLEFGSDANTLAEALYSAHLCGKVLTSVIENHCSE